MNPFSLDLLLHWLDNTPILLQRACVVVVITYVAIRLKWFRHALRGSARYWRYRFITAFFFGVLAIIGTHLGIVVDASQNGILADTVDKLPGGLQQLQAILSFRDMTIISAGLIAGPWVGLGAGLMAGWERYLVGGFVGLSSGLATVVIGLVSGLARHYWQKASQPFGTVIVILVVTAMQKSMVVLLSDPRSVAFATILETVLPETIVNCLGCLLFLSVIKDLERESLVAQAQQAELRALQAQIEPHFINNVLNGINALINDNCPEKASAFVIKLARFLDETRETAKANSITLTEELARAEKYLELQRLRFPDAFRFHYEVAGEWLSCYVPPHCLLTLIINAFLHGRRGQLECLDITINSHIGDHWIILDITDNGCGIPDDQLKLLGKQPVHSERGSGNGLYQLNESLKLAFDGVAKMVIESQSNSGTKITLTLPKRDKSW
ncbi:MAG: histidine kinase [Methylococcaceae bacterium]|nr:histidine kinase [Methylococcaceae bacterium]